MLGGLVPLLGSWWASTQILPSAAWKKSLYFKLDTADTYRNQVPFTLLYRTKSLYHQCQQRGMRLETITQQQQLPTRACEAYTVQSIPPTRPHTPAAACSSWHRTSGSEELPRALTLGAGPTEGRTAASTTSKRSGKALLSFVTRTFCAKM